MLDNTPRNRVQGAWVAPLVGTVLTLPVGLIALAVGGLSPMACDSCNDADAKRFDMSFDTAFTVLQVGLAASLALLIVSWCLVSDERAERRWLFALLPIGTVLISLILFLSLVDWPS
ncbi:hypothetical protein [Streptomyces colonosanans]|uniref:Uncharacterized protein n=1 Tax=Streptomyces colonosanans TaxID=1428652 RepID=A0A1S2NVG9_9ACTN|nr:hypothetical protein [Streptomyces colonosanans]OIJ85427.1 hypothetical protein BIV24_28575 [Streptomyces colonosanans]